MDSETHSITIVLPLQMEQELDKMCNALYPETTRSDVLLELLRRGLASEKCCDGADITTK